MLKDGQVGFLSVHAFAPEMLTQSTPYVRTVQSVRSALYVYQYKSKSLYVRTANFFFHSHVSSSSGVYKQHIFGRPSRQQAVRTGMWEQFQFHTILAKVIV